MVYQPAKAALAPGGPQRCLCPHCGKHYARADHAQRHISQDHYDLPDPPNFTFPLIIQNLPENAFPHFLPRLFVVRPPPPPHRQIIYQDAAVQTEDDPGATPQSPPPSPPHNTTFHRGEGNDVGTTTSPQQHRGPEPRSVSPSHPAEQPAATQPATQPPPPETAPQPSPQPSSSSGEVTPGSLMPLSQLPLHLQLHHIQRQQRPSLPPPKKLVLWTTPPQQQHSPSSSIQVCLLNYTTYIVLLEVIIFLLF